MDIKRFPAGSFPGRRSFINFVLDRFVNPVGIGYVYAHLLHLGENPYRQELDFIEIDQISIQPEFQRKGIIFLLRAFIIAPRLYRGQMGMVVMGAMLPLIGNALGLANLNPFPNMDLTPLAFTLTGVAFALALLRYRFWMSCRWRGTL